MHLPILFFISLWVLVFVLVAVAGCTTRHDPMPKWKGYQLEFTK